MENRSLFQSSRSWTLSTPVTGATPAASTPPPLPPHRISRRRRPHSRCGGLALFLRMLPLPRVPSSTPVVLSRLASDAPPATAC